MAKEHNGRFGKFYSAWAHDENEDEMMDANSKAYIELRAAVNINPRDTDDANDEDNLVYENIATGYAHSSFMVKSKPDWMTMEEAAMLIDRGNLCFGFQTMGNVVTVYTD